MAKISLKTAVMDFVIEVLKDVMKYDLKEKDNVRDILYNAMYRLSLEYLDRVDDVATREMSLEIDSLNQTVDGLRDENRRLRDKEPV